MDERDVTRRFVNHLGHQRGCAKLAVDSWPEDTNRQSPEIDAIAGPFAIEHTSIDSVPNQRRATHWYSRVIGGLGQAIKDSVDCGFTITLEFDAITTGMDWDCIREDLRRWIVNHAARLDHGNHKISLPTSVPVENPTVLHVWKGQGPAITGFDRFEPEDDSLSTRIKKILDTKAAKLGKYLGPDSTTILLVENDDLALVDEHKMLDAIRETYPRGLPQGVDEIWFAYAPIQGKYGFVTSRWISAQRLGQPETIVSG